MSLKGPIISVEDDEDDQYLIRESLRALKLANELRFFSDGQSALDYLKIMTEQPFLILCDINMPVMNGLELRRNINQNENLRKKAIPFIFLTTGASTDVIEAAYEESVQGFYQKAAHYEDLLTQIKLIVSYWQHCLHPNSRK